MSSDSWVDPTAIEGNPLLKTYIQKVLAVVCTVYYLFIIYIFKKTSLWFILNLFDFMLLRNKEMICVNILR